MTSRVTTGQKPGPPRAFVDPDVLPTGLSVRFVALMLVILAGTASIYGHLYVLTHRVVTGGIDQCLGGVDLSRLAGISIGDAEQLRHSALVTTECARGSSFGILVTGGVGVALVGVVSLLLYLLTPAWKIRFARPARRVLLDRIQRKSPNRTLVKLERQQYPAQFAILDGLIAQAGLAEAPEFWIDRVKLTRDSVTFGRAHRSHIRFARLTVAGPLDTFTAVAAHELGHVRNRDNRPTYLTIAAWRAFVALAVLPYLAALAAPVFFGRSNVFYASGAPAVEDLHTTGAVAALVLIAYVSSRAVLRARELQADAVAAHTIGGSEAVLTGAAPARPWWRPALLDTHPSVARRRSAVDDPVRLFAPDALAAFTVGVAVAMLTANLTLVGWSGTLASPLGRGLPPFLAVLGIIASATLPAMAVLSVFAGITMWRLRLAALLAPGRRPTMPLAAALSAGLLVGEPISSMAANANAWGIFDGIGLGSGLTAIAPALGSATFLFAVVAVLFRWSQDNAAVWLPVVRRSLRTACLGSALVAAVGIVPFYLVWWIYHDQSSIVLVDVWTRGLAAKLQGSYWPGPGAEWIQAVYLPVELPSSLPGIGVLLALPGLAFAVGLVRSAPARTPAWLAPIDPGRHASILARPEAPLRRTFAVSGIGVLTFVVAGVGLGFWYRGMLGYRAVLGPALTYLTTAAVDLTVVIAAVGAFVVGGVLARRSPVGATLGVLSTLPMVAGSLFVLPYVVALGTCGPAAYDRCARVTDLPKVLFGFAGVQAPVKAIALAGATLGAAGVAGLLRRGGPGPTAAGLSRRGRLAAYTVIVATLAALVLGAYYGFWVNR